VELAPVGKRVDNRGAVAADSRLGVDHGTAVDHPGVVVVFRCLPVVVHRDRLGGQGALELVPDFLAPLGEAGVVRDQQGVRVRSNVGQRLTSDETEIPRVLAREGEDRVGVCDSIGSEVAVVVRVERLLHVLRAGPRCGCTVSLDGLGRSLAATLVHLVAEVRLQRLEGGCTLVQLQNVVLRLASGGVDEVQCSLKPRLVDGLAVDNRHVLGDE